MRRWLKAVQQHSDSSLRQRLVATISVTFATSAGTISYAGVVIVGVHLIAVRELTMGGLIACSILASACGGKMRRSRQRCSRRCLPMRLMLMLPAPRCAAAAKAAAAATEAAARTAATAATAPVAAATT